MALLEVTQNKKMQIEQEEEEGEEDNEEGKGRQFFKLKQLKHSKTLDYIVT